MCEYLKSHALRVALTAIVLLSFVAQASPQTAASLPRLELGKPLSSELAGGETRVYEIPVDAGQFLQISIDQKDAGFVARLLASDSKLITESASSELDGQILPLTVIASAGGKYRIEFSRADPKATAQKYRIAIDIQAPATPLDEKRLMAAGLFKEGETLYGKGLKKEFSEAIKKFEAAVPIWHELGSRSLEARTLFHLGAIDSILGNRETATERLTKSADMYHAIGEYFNEATPINSLGLISYYQGDYRLAEERYNKVLSILGDDDPGSTATVLNNLAILYSKQGEDEKTIRAFQQAVDIHRKQHEKNAEALTLINLGSAYLTYGEFQQALGILLQALSMVRENGDHFNESWALRALANAYVSIGEFDKALDYSQQALAAAQATGNPRDEGAALVTIGSVYSKKDEPQKALDSFNRALAILQRIGDRRKEAQTLSRVGDGYAALQDSGKALDYYGRALAAARALGDPHGEAGALLSIGSLQLDMKSPGEAIQSLNASLPLFHQVGEQPREGIVLFEIARAELMQGHLEDAKARAEEAISLTETIRQTVATSDFRASFFSTVHARYELFISVLMQLDQAHPDHGYAVAAFEASERSRARSLLDQLNESRIDIRQNVDTALLEKERSLSKRLATKHARHLELLGQKNSAQVRQELEKEIQSLSTEYQQVEVQIRTSSPRYAALTQPQPLTLAEIQAQLDEGTLLLEYVLGSDRSYLFAVTLKSLTAYSLPARARIEEVARQAYSELNQPNAPASSSNAIGALTEILLGPVTSQLGNKRLAVVTEGALQYIPFAALPDHSRLPLLAKHEVLSLPSASTLAVIRREIKGRPPASNLVAVFADPVFSADDPRVGHRGSVAVHTPDNLERSAKDSGLLSFDRLSASRQEADAINRLAQPNKAMEALGFDANLASATGDKLAQYRIVHFATHGLMDSKNPELSGLVLSLVDSKGKPQNGFLDLGQIYNMKLNADLVVLSACRTALGKEIRGEGLMGLTRGFMYAGAPTVVASVWKVPDLATADLMKRFYSGMLQKHLRPAAALQAAQLSIRQDPRWKAPYFWAGFTLQGDWR